MTVADFCGQYRTVVDLYTTRFRKLFYQVRELSPKKEDNTVGVGIALFYRPYAFLLVRHRLSRCK